MLFEVLEDEVRETEDGAKDSFVFIVFFWGLVLGLLFGFVFLFGCLVEDVFGGVCFWVFYY